MKTPKVGDLFETWATPCNRNGSPDLTTNPAGNTPTEPWVKVTFPIIDVELGGSAVRVTFSLEGTIYGKTAWANCNKDGHKCYTYVYRNGDKIPFISVEDEIKCKYCSV